MLVDAVLQLDGRVLCSWGCWWVLLLRVLRGMQFGVLVDAALRA